MAPPIDLRTELLIGSTWTDISTYTLYDNPDSGTAVSITRGQADESPRTTASTLVMPLDNRDGRFSSRNPLGAYYPNLVQNTQVRESVPEGASYLRCEFTGFDFTSAPDSAGTSVTGDIDIRLDVTLDNWNASQVLASKWTAAGGQRSWIILLNEDGTLSFAYSPDGAVIRTATSTAVISVPPLRRAGIRVTYGVATGQVTFYIANAGPNQVLSGPVNPTWTPAMVLGAVVPVTFGNIFDSTASTRFGAPGTAVSSDFPNHTGIYGKCHYLEYRSGFSGTIVASPNFTTATAGASSITDAQGNVWNTIGQPEISNRRYRFHGEVAAWPQTWDPTQSRIVVNVTANGLLRRLGQSSKPLASAIRRYWKKLAINAPVAYWPCEDGNRSTGFASSLPGGTRMDIVSGSPKLGASTAALCSAALPVLNQSYWLGVVPPYSGQDAVVSAIVTIPPASDQNGGIVAGMNLTGGTIGQVFVQYNTGSGGTLTLLAYDSNGVLISFSTQITGVDGQSFMLRFAARTSGGNVICTQTILLLGQGASPQTQSFTATTATVGRASNVFVNPPPSPTLSGTAVGHIAVQGTWSDLSSLAVTPSPVTAWQGEAAGARFSRLCAEENVAFRGAGQLSASSPMGPQLSATLLSLLQDCADADQGVMTEPRQVLGLGYRTRYSLSGQSPAVTLDNALAALSGLTPTDDDFTTVNDLTVARTSGSQHRVAVTSGPKSTQSPPAGVGVYDQQITVNVNSDSQCRDEAGWGTWLGTQNEPRYPLIALNFRRAALAGVFYDLQDTDIGDYVRIINPLAQVTADPIRQIVKQTVERISGFIYEADWAGAPEAPYETAVVSDLVLGRCDTDGSTLFSAVNSTAQQLQVKTAGAQNFPLWTTALTSGWSFTVSGTPGDAVHFIVTTGQSASITVGDVFTDTTNPAQGFRVTAISAPFAGFVNISFTPNAGSNMNNPDVVTQSLGDFPFDINAGGERLTVAKIAAAPAAFLTGDASGFEGGIANWTAAGNCTIAQTAAAAHTGTKSLALTSQAAGNMQAASCAAANVLTQGLACSAGDLIQLAMWAATAVSVRSDNIGAEFYDSTATPIGGAVRLADVLDGASFVNSSGTVQAPAGAAVCRANFQVKATGAASEVHYIDDVLMGNMQTQVFTVIRSVNGIVKAQTAGTDVRLFFPPVLAM